MEGSAAAPTVSTHIVPLEERESIEQQVARTLRELIVDGKLPEGTPLVQRDLAQQLGVSPTPVRAGLSQLEREGFVAVTPTGRAIVSRLTREDFEEIYAARLGLEGLAARVGAHAVGRGEIAHMKETLRILRRLAAAQDVNAYLHGRWEFHATCYRASGRQRLVDEVGPVRGMEAEVGAVEVAVRVPVLHRVRPERVAQRRLSDRDRAHGSSVSEGTLPAARSNAHRMLSCTAASACSPLPASHAARKC